MVKPKTARIDVRFPEEGVAAIQVEATKEGRKLPDMVRVLCSEALQVRRRR